MTTGQPKARSTIHALLRRGVVALILLTGLAVGAVVDAGSAGAQSGPYCSPFGSSVQDGWGPCSAAPNIAVTTSNAGSIGGASDWYLKLTDQSGASAACSSDPKYRGNWVEKTGGCGQFCFDIRIIDIPYAPTTVIHPSFNIYGSPGMRADYYANLPATTDAGSSPGWHHICAPVRLTQPGENLPSDSGGHWQIAGSAAPNVLWNQIITNVTQVQLPVDFTPQPSEVVGYDNICLGPGDCGDHSSGGGTGASTDCLKDMKAAVKCNPDGTYTLTTNGAGSAGTDVTLTSRTPGVTVVPQQQPWSATMTWTLAGAKAGQAVTLTADATKLGGGTAAGTDSCCSGEIKITMPDCPKPVDVKIEKTGGTSPAPQVNVYAFHLTVTNKGAAFTGNNVITVTDVVPAGMTFTSASGGPDWTCSPPTVAAAGTLTCTYVGAGPTAPNQALSTINISATALGAAPFPPFTNCATVAFTPASGLVDANTVDNTSCVTVRKAALCPTPLVPGPTAGSCVCPQGTVLLGRECVKPPQQACAAPLVPGAAAGSCVCPQGTVLLGRECVKPPQQACAAPLVPGAAAGSCVCPQGTVLMGRECAKPPQQACAAPLVPGAVAGSCVCPQETVLQGRECVRPQQHACAPPLVPGAAAGSCVCPQGTVLQGRECVKPQQHACTAPMVSGAVAGSCVCPQGTVLQGRECVRPQQHACTPPLVPGAAAGSCVCPQGTVLQGRECVPQRAAPQLPFGLPNPEAPSVPRSGGQPAPAGTK